MSIAILEDELKRNAAKGWDKQPLSLLWCLDSFDKSKEDENSIQSRVILYDSDSKTVMAVKKGIHLVYIKLLILGLKE